MTAIDLDLPMFPMARSTPLDPPPELLRLQRDEPLARVRLHSGQESWLVTRYDDVKELLTDRRLSADMRKPGFPLVHETLSAVGPGRLNHMDPPEHDVFRRMLAPEFMVRRVEEMRPFITSLAHSLVDAIEAMGPPVDLVQALAIPVPATATCSFLGVPYSDREYFVSYVETSLGGEASADEARAATASLRQYFYDLVAEKRRNPTDDLLSRVAREHVASGALSVDELVGLAELLLTAGFDTTWNMIALGTLTLLEHREQLEQLAADPSLATSAVEELLRYLTVPHLGRHRVATESIEIHGRTIHPGEAVIAAPNAANRDPSAFPDPDRFDIRRGARHHLAFGHGIHQCLAASLARVELQEVFPVLLARLPKLRLEGTIEALNFKDRSAVYGVCELPVSW